MKKAVLLTIGMLFLSSLVFSLAVILFHNTQGTESRFAEIILYDRLYDLDSSIQRGFKEIFIRNSGITLRLVNDTVTVIETLPHTSNFAAEMDTYEDYLEEAYSADPLVTIDDTVLTNIKNDLPLYIMPHNILIEHSSFPSGDILELTPSSLNVENYSISLTALTQQSVVFNPSIDPTPPLDFPLRISVTTNSGTSTQIYDINPGQTNPVTLTFSDGGNPPTETDVTVILNNPAALTINRKGIAIYHNIEIALDHQTEQMNYITYPNNLFTINIPGDNLQKTSTVRIV